VGYTLGPLEIVDERKRRLSGCTRCDQIRQELHTDSLLGVRAPLSLAEVVVLCVSIWSGSEGQGATLNTR
jgi:hypothetical protein